MLATTALWPRSVLRFSFACGLRPHAKLNDSALTVRLHSRRVFCFPIFYLCLPLSSAICSQLVFVFHAFLCVVLFVSWLYILNFNWGGGAAPRISRIYPVPLGPPAGEPTAPQTPLHLGELSPLKPPCPAQPGGRLRPSRRFDRRNFPNVQGGPWDYRLQRGGRGGSAPREIRKVQEAALPM